MRGSEENLATAGVNIYLKSVTATRGRSICPSCQSTELDNWRKEVQQCRKKRSRGFDIRLEMSAIFANFVTKAHCVRRLFQQTDVPVCSAAGGQVCRPSSSSVVYPTIHDSPLAASRWPSRPSRGYSTGLLLGRSTPPSRRKRQIKELTGLLYPYRTRMLKTWGRHRELLSTK